MPYESMLFTRNGVEIARVRCRKCNKTFDIKVSHDSVRRHRQGTLVQDAMPGLTPDQRELFVSGICGSCFDYLFPPEVDDES